MRGQIVPAPKRRRSPRDGGARGARDGQVDGAGRVPLQPDPELGAAQNPRTLPPHVGRTSLDRCREFGFYDSTVDSEHSPQRKSSQSQAFLSLCGLAGSWSVYTKLQALEENLQPYHWS